MDNGNIESNKKEEVFYGSPLKTGDCGITPFFASVNCAKRRLRGDLVCKNCWMNK